MLIGKDTKITVNHKGKTSTLPVAFYYMRTLTGSEYTDPDSGNPITIAKVGRADLVSVMTNVSDGHSIEVEPSVSLELWDGGHKAAGSCKGAQLRGQHGMYVVGGVKQINEVTYKVTGVTRLGGIFCEE